MKRIFTLLTLLLVTASLWAQQQKGALKGVVRTSDGQPASFVNVTIKNTNKGTTTDAEGRYEIKNVDAGDQVLVISFVGLQTKEQPAHVVAGQVSEVQGIELSEDQQKLSEVVVVGQHTNPFDKKQSDYVSKMPLKNIENPQVYNTVSAELIRDQVVTNFNDALRNAPGVSRLWESTGRGGDGAGYYSMRGFAVQPTLVNGLPALVNGNLDIANIERIEVMKGPSGTLYGSSLISYGGLINVMTKRPYDHFGGEVSYSTGSFGLNRVTLDVNTPVSADKKIALRVNTSYHTENSFQDAGFRKSFFFAPSLSYQVNDKLSFLVNTEFLQSENTNQTMLFVARELPLSKPNMAAMGYDNKRSYTSNDLSIKNPAYSFQGQMNYQISKSWRSQTAVSRSSGNSNGYYSYLYEANMPVPGGAPGEIMHIPIDGFVFARWLSKQNATTSAVDIQQNFIGDFKVGEIRNRIVAGLDYLHTERISNSSGYAMNGLVYIGNASLQQQNEMLYNITDPKQYVLNGDNGVLTQAGTDALLAGATTDASKATQQVFSAYVSDVVNITPALSAMASLRIDHFRNKDNKDASQTTLSPKFGLVYQPIQDQLSVFANYMNGFSNVAPQLQGDPSSGVPQTLRTFNPEHANQWEVGVKSDMFDGRLAASASYYDIRVTDIVMAHPTVPFTFVQDGETYSRGIEASVTASPVSGLSIVAGFSHNDNKIEKTDSEDYRGRRSENAGPENMGNAWVSYRFTSGALRGYGVAFGANYASKYATLNRLTTGVFELPSYTILGASVSYENDAFRFALKVDNLTDEEYYTGWSTINPQKPANVTANIAFKF